MIVRCVWLCCMVRVIGKMAVTLATCGPAGPECYALFETEWGYAAIVCRGAVVAGLIPPAPTIAAAQREVLRTTAQPSRQDGLLAGLRSALQQYFRTGRARFDCEVDVSWAGAFARKVLCQCCRIQPGDTATYGQLADRIGCKGAARAVGSALAANRAPIIVPCHRVVAADGSLGGYSAAGGVNLKRRLLRLEQAACAESSK